MLDISYAGNCILYSSCYLCFKLGWSGAVLTNCDHDGGHVDVWILVDAQVEVAD